MFKKKLLVENVPNLFLIFPVDYFTRWICILPLYLATNFAIHGYFLSLTWDSSDIKFAFELLI